MILGKYNQAKTITFDLVAPDGVDLIINATFTAGDVVIMKDEGAEANTTNLPTDEGTGYSLVLTATEMSAARIRVYIIDQTGTKIWLDISFGIETYGNISAEHERDLDAAIINPDNAGIAANGVSIGALNDFDPAVDVVANVTLVATTTTNTDMRGNDTAPDNAGIAQNNVDINALNDFNPATDTVAIVTTLTNKTGFSLAATGLDAIVSTANGMVEIAKAIWDRVLTGATHNINNSAGKRLRQIAASDIVSSGTAQAGTATTITLAAGENANNSFYDHTMIIIDGGTGVGQSRTIEGYDGTTKIATISDTWVITPDNTSTYSILPDSVAHIGFITSIALTSITGDIDTNSTKLATLVGNTQVPKINVAFNDLQVLMVDSVDNVTPKTGLTLTVTRSINSGAFAAATGTAAEISNGMYQFDASAADMNGAVITFKFSGAGADDTFVTVYTKP